MRLTTGLVLLLFLTLAAAPSTCAGQPPFDLNYNLIDQPLRQLGSDDQAAVQQAIELIQRGDYAASLIRLSALSDKNPGNSSLHILAAYAKLLVGNALGAFNEAQTAERAKDGNHYKCWFLAKIALLTGHNSECERELKHIEKFDDMKGEVKSMRAELKTKQETGAR